MSIAYSKRYGPNDKTRSGICKNGWRLVIANVDTTFVESLHDFPFGHPFKIGASSAQVRLLSNPGEPSLPEFNYDDNVLPQPPRLTSHQRLVQEVQEQKQLQHAQFRYLQATQLGKAVPSVASHEIPQAEVETSKLPSLGFPYVPDLVKAIKVPVPHEQVKPKKGPGSRGGKKAKNMAAAAASAVARKAYKTMCEGS